MSGLKALHRRLGGNRKSTKLNNRIEKDVLIIIQKGRCGKSRMSTPDFDSLFLYGVHLVELLSNEHRSKCSYNFFSMKTDKKDALFLNHSYQLLLVVVFEDHGLERGYEMNSDC